MNSGDGGASGAPEGGAGSPPPLYPLTNIWDPIGVELFTRTRPDGKVIEMMRCKFCPPIIQQQKKNEFVKNPTKLLYHMCGIALKGIVICTGISPEDKRRYTDYNLRKQQSRGRKAAARVETNQHIDNLQNRSLACKNIIFHLLLGLF